MNNFSLYMHICPNGKKYIGITSQVPKSRWDSNGYGYKYCPLFYRAIKKYGWDNIEHIIICTNLSKEWACKLEQDFIRIYDTHNPKYGYNLTLGGEGTFGYKETKEQLCRKSELMKGNTRGKGYKHTPEAIEKIRKASIGRKVSKETKEKIKKSRSWYKHSDETKAKISKSHLGIQSHCVPHTEETKKKISESCKGRVVSEETRNKLRQKAIEQWQRQKKEKNKI